jgi:hypothetical protein
MLLNHYTEMSFIRAKSDILKEEFAKTEKFNLDILSRIPKNDHALRALTYKSSQKMMIQFLFLNYI